MTTVDSTTSITHGLTADLTTGVAPASRRRAVAGSVALGAYVAAVVAANVLTDRFGLVPVGFGQVATAGTVAVGGAVMLRDLLQDAWGRRAVLAAIAAGAGLSFVLASPALAAASAVTFLLAEGLETVVYTPLRRRTTLGSSRWAGAVLAANVTGALVDTVVFLQLAGFPVLVALPGQLIGKLWVTVGVLAVATVARHRRR